MIAKLTDADAFEHCDHMLPHATTVAVKETSRVPGYAILLDGERVARLNAEDDVRAWIAKYRDDHREDDPSAAHLQILERGPLAWLTGGRLVDRKRFL